MHCQVEQNNLQKQLNNAISKIENIEHEQSYYQKKILVSETLLSIPIGETVEIARKDIKDRSVVYAATRLKRKGIYLEHPWQEE